MVCSVSTTAALASVAFSLSGCGGGGSSTTLAGGPTTTSAPQHTTTSEPGPNQPGSGENSRIGKSTFACSKHAATVAYDWEMKYLPVDEANDDCPDRTCTCGVQSRVALKTSSAMDTTGRPGPQGFGLHCTYAGGQDDDRANANGGVTEEEVEKHFAQAIGNWSAYDSDVNVRAWASYSTSLWAESGLDWYVTKFQEDGVNFHLGSWLVAESTYWSLLVLIPDSPVVLELQGDCSLCGDASAKRMPVGYVGFRGATPPRKLLVPQAEKAEQGLLHATMVSRATDDLEAVATYYQAVFGLQPVATATLGDGAEVADYQPGGTSVTMRYVKRGGQAGERTTSWFQKLLLDTAKKYQTAPDACFPVWGDHHIGGSFGDKTLLELVTSAGELGYPYRSFAGGAGPDNVYFVEPTGWWIQAGGDSTGLPEAGGFETDYCYSFCSAEIANV